MARRFCLLKQRLLFQSVGLAFGDVQCLCPLCQVAYPSCVLAIQLLAAAHAYHYFFWELGQFFQSGQNLILAHYETSEQCSSFLSVVEHQKCELEQGLDYGRITLIFLAARKATVRRRRRNFQKQRPSITCLSTIDQIMLQYNRLRVPSDQIKLPKWFSSSQIPLDGNLHVSLLNGLYQTSKHCYGFSCSLMESARQMGFSREQGMRMAKKEVIVIKN